MKSLSNYLTAIEQRGKDNLFLWFGSVVMVSIVIFIVVIAGAILFPFTAIYIAVSAWKEK
jgi:hypothetical protein